MNDELESIEDPQASEDALAQEPPILESESDVEGELPVVADDAEAESEPEVAAAAEPEAAAEPIPAAPTPEAPIEAPHSVSWVPFSVYLALWVILAVATFFVLRTSAVDGGALWAPEYAFSVYGGIVLVALGPILAVVVWLVARSKVEAGHRTGLLSSSFLRAAGATFIGVILWLVALNLLDYFRAGLNA